MITANEARNIVQKIEKEEQEALERAIEKFLSEKCDPAIMVAASSKLHDVLIDLPPELDNHSNKVCTTLASYGFKTQVRFGMRNAVLITW